MRHAWGAVWRPGLIPVVAGIAGVLGLLWVVLVAAPPWFVHDRSLEGLKAQNEVRSTLLQGLGGVVLLVGAYFTYRQVANSRQQLAHSYEQLQIAQQGQITERFTRAIDQLGHSQLDVRLGGIYALERIARDSSTDRATIGEVLTAFVRSHAPWPPRLPGQYVAAAPLAEVAELQIRAADVQAGLTVLGRGGFAILAPGQGELDLHSVDLRHANLRSAHLMWADLRGAHLEGAFLPGAHLERANFYGAYLAEAYLNGAYLAEALLLDANLEGADLRDAHLEEANVQGAYVKRAILTDAHLERADLRDARLDGANLRGARLDGADLRGAHLEGADLYGAHLSGGNLWTPHLVGAVADERTVWPKKFDRRSAGVILAGEDTVAKG